MFRILMIIVVIVFFLPACEQQEDADLPLDERAINILDQVLNPEELAELPVQGMFIDEVVTNLGFQCNGGEFAHRSFTEDENPNRLGLFSCPIGTISVTFFLGNNLELVLGTVPIVYLGPNTLSFVLPTDLTNNDLFNPGDFAEAKVNNIAILLQSLDSDGVAFNPSDFNNVIKIPDEAHSLLTEKGEAFFSRDFINKPVTGFVDELERSGFIEELHDELVSQNMGLNQATQFSNNASTTNYVLPALARRNLEISAGRLAAGVYVGAIVPDFETEANVYLSAEFNIFVDRAHRLFGFGNTSLVSGPVQGATEDPFVDQEIFVLDERSNFDITGKLNENFVAGGIVEDGETNTRMEFSGRIVNKTMFANRDQFTTTFPDSTFRLSLDDLGRVKATDVIRSGNDFEAAVTLHQAGIVSQNLDLEILEQLRLPLHYVITLYTFPFVAFADDDEPDPFKPELEVEEKLYITFTELGNIVTDIDNNCSPVDEDTLVDEEGTQEYVVGFIGSTRLAGPDEEGIERPARASFLMLVTPPEHVHFGFEMNANLKADDLSLFNTSAVIQGGDHVVWRNRFNLAYADFSQVSTEEDVTNLLQDSQINGAALGAPRTCSGG